MLLLWFMQKWGPSSSRVYWILAQQSIGTEMLAIRVLNNLIIQELLLADLAKTQYTRDDEGPYSRINLDQHK